MYGDDWTDVITDNLGKIILGAIVVLVVVAIIAAKSDDEHRSAFMAQCREDHKEYECDAMWRSGESHTTVAPVPVIIPVR